jgi:hypothetical protein
MPLIFIKNMWDQLTLMPIILAIYHSNFLFCFRQVISLSSLRIKWKMKSSNCINRKLAQLKGFLYYTFGGTSSGFLVIIFFMSQHICNSTIFGGSHWPKKTFYMEVVYQYSMLIWLPFETIKTWGVTGIVLIVVIVIVKINPLSK